MRRLTALAIASVALLLTAGPTLACGGLVGPNGAVNLLRTTTFAGYHDGVEHYITAFEFAGGEGEFGSIVPLPDVPSDVVKGGDWTLQRLILETDPPDFAFEAAAVGLARADAEVLMQVRIDALDITVLRGGGDQVGTWASEHGFRLPPDAPEVLDFYARRSPIFLAAVFDADAARERGQQIGDGTPVHITIPTDDPWVPLRILALGRQPVERVEADVYLLTDSAPNLLPDPTFTDGLDKTHSAWASDLLLSDLRSDAGMEWVPESGYLTKIEIDSAAPDLTYDLAIDPTGISAPSPVDAGLEFPIGTALMRSTTASVMALLLLVAVAIVPIGLVLGAVRTTSGRRPPLAGAGG
ncbi:MAG: DUF2330 domain-containing protein [Candidatus Limnocylindria bacterium]